MCKNCSGHCQQEVEELPGFNNFAAQQEYETSRETASFMKMFFVWLSVLVFCVLVWLGACYYCFHVLLKWI